MLRRIALYLLVLLNAHGVAAAADVKVLAPNAAREAVSEAIAVFERATGQKVIVSWSGTEAITKRIADGEVVDLVVNAAQNIDRQSKDGKLAGSSRSDFARSGIGAAAVSRTSSRRLEPQLALCRPAVGNDTTMSPSTNTPFTLSPQGKDSTSVGACFCR